MSQSCRPWVSGPFASGQGQCYILRYKTLNLCRWQLPRIFWWPASLPQYFCSSLVSAPYSLSFLCLHLSSSFPKLLLNHVVAPSALPEPFPSPVTAAMTTQAACPLHTPPHRTAEAWQQQPTSVVSQLALPSAGLTFDVGQAGNIKTMGCSKA